MTSLSHRMLYSALVLAGAVLVLVAASAAASGGMLGALSATKARKPVPNKISNNRQGKAFLVVKNAVPGRAGRGRVVLANVGTNPIRTVRLTQDQVKTGGISGALQLQIFDVNAKRCLYPRPKLPKPKPGRKPPKEPARCLKWMPFKGGKALRNLQVPAIKGTAWKRKEKHAIDVRWRLAPDSPNTDQGKTASFRLVWRFVA